MSTGKLTVTKWTCVILAGLLYHLSICGFSNPAAAQVRQEVFLPNTDHELNVYRVFGDEPGKTIMIIGGIQGDEPGSYLTADLYADIHLQRGNLIVVPRANLYSILLNRREGLTGDMNRKFGRDKDINVQNHLEEEIVTILKHLIAESDCLLNLHEGSGFYAPQWINDQENPNLYGQSIIYDAASYVVPESGRTIHLEELAQRVVEGVNARIENPRYRFRPNNHNTWAPDSLHKEQRKSATFYALTRAHIPAFGVETSKTIDMLETKIQLQKLVINTFMREFDIILDTPGVEIRQPELDYLLIKVNNDHPVALSHQSVLELSPGDEVMVSEIIANYPRGLVADIEGVGTKNDTGMAFRIAKDTRILIHKDAEECGWVDLKVKLETAGRMTPQPPAPEELKAEQLLVNINDTIMPLTEGNTLYVVRGDRLILQGIRTNSANLDSEIQVNFKGFAPPKSVNDGNDLYFPIHTERDLWPRYSENSQGRRYPIIAAYKDKPIGKFWVELNDP